MILCQRCSPWAPRHLLLLLLLFHSSPVHSTLAPDVSAAAATAAAAAAAAEEAAAAVVAPSAVAAAGVSTATVPTWSTGLQQQPHQQQLCPVTLPAGRCVCRQGDCSPCPHCAGCDNRLCIDPPAGSTILHTPVLTGKQAPSHGRQLLQSTAIVDLQIAKVVLPAKLKRKKAKKQPSAAAAASGLAASTQEGLSLEDQAPDEGSDKTDEQAAADTDDEDGGDTGAAIAAAAAAAPKSGPSGVGPPGSTFNFQITIDLTNAFPGPATAVRMYDNLPSGLTAVSLTEQPSDEACGMSADGSRVACAWASIGPNDRKTVTIKTKGLTTGLHLNCASVSTSSADVNPGNDESCAAFVVQGACCTLRPASGSSSCTDTTPQDCPDVDSPTLVQAFYPDTSCNLRPCKPTGACCLASSNGNVICASKLTAEMCALNGGVFGGVGSTCSQLKCSTQLPPGACCLEDAGICVDLAAGGEATCVASGGRYYQKRKCRSIKDKCSPPKTADLALVLSGPSDTVKLGQTFELTFMVKLSTTANSDSVQQVKLSASVVQPGLTLLSVSETPDSGGKIEIAAGGASFTASWPRMAVPGDALRTVVARVKSSTTGGFLTTGVVTTSSPEASLLDNKDFFIVDVQGSSPTCVTEWRRCNPSNDDCCSGLRCQATWPGCPAGAFVCKAPASNSACQDSAGQACGGQTGKTCCAGLICHWNYANRQGSCQRAGSCIAPGHACSNDIQVCRGSRCIRGRCTVVVPKMCHKKCSTYSCNLERRKNCDALYASAASL